MRRLMIASAVCAFASAVLAYGIANDTRIATARAEADERTLEKVRRDVAVLKAERGYLARPERIAPLARGLGLGPPAAGQIVRGSGNSAQRQP